jgi:hypothetical protein
MLEADRMVSDLRAPAGEDASPGRHRGTARPAAWSWSPAGSLIAHDDPLWTSPSSIAGASFTPAALQGQEPPRMPPPGQGRFAVPEAEHITIPDGPPASRPRRPAAETAEIPVVPDSLGLYLDGLPRYTD